MCVCLCVCVCVCVCVFVCVCVCVVVEITKEAWEKCGIKTLICHKKEEKINELWQKMRDIEIQLRHSNTANVVLKRIRKYCGKKIKKHYRRRRRKIQDIF